MGEREREEEWKSTDQSEQQIEKNKKKINKMK